MKANVFKPCENLENARTREIKTSNYSFNSKYTDIRCGQLKNLEEVINKMKEKCIESFNKFTDSGSGWSLIQVNYLQVSTYATKIGKGAKYIVRVHTVTLLEIS